MSPAELNALADRVEAGTADQQAELLLLAWDALNPKPDPDYQPRREPSFSPEFNKWAKDDARFKNLVQFEAFESAAVMLVPEGHIFAVANTSVLKMTVNLAKATALCGLPDETRGGPYWREAVTVAFALAAAALRSLARAAEGEAG